MAQNFIKNYKNLDENFASYKSESLNQKHFKIHTSFYRDTLEIPAASQNHNQLIFEFS